MASFGKGVIGGLDLFGYGQFYTFRKRNSHSTVPTFICSLMVLVGLAVLLVVGLIEVIDRKVVYSSSGLRVDGGHQDQEILIDGRNFMVAYEAIDYSTGLSSNLTTVSVVQLRTSSSSSMIQT